MAEHADFSERMAVLTRAGADGLEELEKGDLTAAERILDSSRMAASIWLHDSASGSEEWRELESARLNLLRLLATTECQIGAGLRRQGKFLDAVTYALRAAKRHRQLKEYQRRALVLENAANAYLDMHRPDRAEPLYSECLDTLESLNDDAKAAEVKSTIQQIRGVPPLQRIVEAHRAQTAACVGAEELLRSGQTKAALDLADQILTRFPDSGGAWDMKGQCLKSLGRSDEALRCHRKSVECDPTDPVAFRNLAFHLDAMGRYREALDEQGHACDLAPEDGEVACGFALYLMKCYETESIPRRPGVLYTVVIGLEEAIEFAPRWARSYAFKAQVLMELGFLEEAGKTLEQGRAAGLDEATITAVTSALRKAGGGT